MRLRMLLLLLVGSVQAVLAYPILAGPTLSPSPTATPTPSPEVTPTPPPGDCPAAWPLVTVLTSGRSNSPSNNAKVVHAITGFIVAPSSLSPEDNQIRVCPGTTVTSVVSDLTGGTPLNQANSSGISCNSLGCTAYNIERKQTYISHSADGSDTDRISLVPR